MRARFRSSASLAAPASRSCDCRPSHERRRDLCPVRVHLGADRGIHGRIDIVLEPAASLVIVDDNVQSPGVAPIDHLLDLGHVGGDLVGSLVGVTVPGAGA